MKTRKTAGVSLLEVVIASAILIVVVLIAMGLLFSSTTLATNGSLASDLENRGRQFTDFAREEFLQGRFTGQIQLIGLPTNLGIDPNLFSTAIAYQMPGGKDVNGNDLGIGKVVFGYPSPIPAAPGFRQTLACFIRFEADSVFKESAAAPNAVQLADWGSPFPNYPALPTPVILNMDINKDGDRNDTIVRGRIRKYIVVPFDPANPVFTANGSNCLLGTETLDDYVMLRVNPSAGNQFNWNVDSELAAPPSQLDPLFLFVDENGPDGTLISNANVDTLGKGVAVTPWHGTYDQNGKGFLMRKDAVTVRFRNIQ